MSVIPCRSDYIITCDADTAQIATKIELFIWKFVDTEPTTPTKVVEKTAYSPSQYINYYNISPFIADYLKAFGTDDMAVNVKIVKYHKLTTTWIEDETIQVVSTYGVNNIGGSIAFPLFNSIYPFYYRNGSTLLSGVFIPSIDIIFNFNFSDTLRVVYSSDLGTTINDYSDVGIQYFRIPLVINNAFFIDGNNVELQYFDGSGFITFKNIVNITPVCEQKYETFYIYYVNLYGGMSKFAFFKKSSEIWEVKSNDYQLSNSYPEIKSQTKVFNKNGRDSIKLNTGWIDEKYVKDIKELSLSEDLYLVGIDGVVNTSVKLKNTSFAKRTSLNDRNINYEMEFEFVTEII